jgi:ketose-bisphosphate aldolase
MLAMYVVNVHYCGMDWFAEAAKWCANKVGVPGAIHLDHGDTFENCIKATRLGFTSVMLDCSTESIDENIRKTIEVIKEEHAVKVLVEAEVGELQRLDADCSVKENKYLANVEGVLRFVERCQPDMLVVEIGNAHDFYEEKPEIRLDILRDIRNITNIRLVMHGATGIPEEDVTKAISIGIAKINFGIRVRHRYFEHHQEAINILDHKAYS